MERTLDVTAARGNWLPTTDNYDLEHMEVLPWKLFISGAGGECSFTMCVTMHSYALEKDRYSQIVLGCKTKQSKNDKGYLERV